MLKILSKISEKIKNGKARRAVKLAEKLARKAELLKMRAASISSPKAVKQAKAVAPKKAVAPVVKAAKSKKPLLSIKLPSLKKSGGKLFSNSASKSIKSFYANTKSIYKMIRMDRETLKGSQFAPNQNDSLRGRLAVSKNQVVISDLERLNFFAIHKEIRAQEQLDAAAPGKYLKKSNKASLAKIKVEMNNLQKEIYSVYQRKHIESAFTEKMNRINEESKVFSNAANLTK